MTSTVLLALVALLTWRWWLPLWRSLRADLEAPSEPESRPRAEALLGPRPLAGESRVPPSRLLAFQGVRLRASRRQRWEGGFGRRGL